MNTIPDNSKINLKEFQEFILSIEKTKKIPDPDSIEFGRDLAVSFVNKGKFDHAINSMMKVIKENGGAFDEDYSALSSILAWSGQYKKAIFLLKHRKFSNKNQKKVNNYLKMCNQILH